MKKAKIVHDNLNARGGSERVAFATIELLNKLGFQVDISTFQIPDLDEIKREFGGDELNLWRFDQIEFLDINTVLGLEKMDGYNNEIEEGYKRKILNNNKFDDRNYDIIINTHGDLFPYYNNLDCGKKDSLYSRSPIRITYCHYPLVPQLIYKRDYSFLERYIDSFNKISPQKKDIIVFKTLEKYHEMMKNTTVLANSEFSKAAIEKIYGKDEIEVTVVYPPVEIDKFRTLDTLGENTNTVNNTQDEKSRILVISRISPAKGIENVLEIGKELRESHGLHNFEINIVGSITAEDIDYAQNLEALITQYKLENNIKIHSNVAFQELQRQIKESKLYLHPTLEEPFGISIVEAMSAGLIPITPDSGGGTEFVPSQYQYSTTKDASSMIYKILKNINSISGGEIEIERQNIKRLTNKFAKQKFYENLTKVIASLSTKSMFNNSLSSQPFVDLYPQVVIE